MDNQGFSLAVAESLSGRKIRVVGDVNPMRYFFLTGKRFKISYNKFLKEMERFPLDTEPLELSASFTDMTYRASELFEAFEKFPDTIDQLSKRIYREHVRDYRRIVSSHRRDWSLICNKIKHNYHKLFCFYFFKEGNNIKIPAFVLWKPGANSSWKTNTDLHKKKEGCRSMFMAAKMIIFDIHCVDAAASRLVAHTFDDSDEGLPSAGVEILDAKTLSEVRSIPSIVIRNESVSHFSILDSPLELTEANYFIRKTDESWGYRMHLSRGDGANVFPVLFNEVGGIKNYIINGITRPLNLPNKKNQ